MEHQKIAVHAPLVRGELFNLSALADAYIWPAFRAETLIKANALPSLSSELGILLPAKLTPMMSMIALMHSKAVESL